MREYRIILVAAAVLIVITLVAVWGYRHLPPPPSHRPLVVPRSTDRPPSTPSRPAATRAGSPSRR
ncbi:conserved hypothetical protein; putative signal peptide [Frankia alni ACN14a]|uniref:Uncharacterized protein n=1 Tax=Frankia alni (strain DSM 45986 / CECT 9034 / ACN14a) TaxID=326424 RepID=Q0RMC0_FRAAA|nr:conserved hypothetical protein; putative signal peptide [Frankia alni ACN14a]